MGANFEIITYSAQIYECTEIEIYRSCSPLQMIMWQVYVLFLAKLMCAPSPPLQKKVRYLFSYQVKNLWMFRSNKSWAIPYQYKVICLPNAFIIGPREYIG